MDMEHVHLEEAATYGRLMCIVAICEAVLWLVGAEAERRHLQRRYTPSQPRNGRRVLSLRRLEQMVLGVVCRPIVTLIQDHIVRAMKSVIQTVGEMWRDARRGRRVKCLVESESTVKKIPRACIWRNNGMHYRTLPKILSWILRIDHTVAGPGYAS
jgi:hypothetical protein